MELVPWRPGRTLVDPMCGSGTLLIEAAMKGINMAPGMNREFISESVENFVSITPLHKKHMLVIFYMMKKLILKFMDMI